jgi:phage-related protein
MEWKIFYYNKKLGDQVLSLPNKLLARYLKLTDIMMKYGPNLGHPHTKNIGDGLLEMRIKAKEGIARVFYCTMIKRKIIMLHSILKKKQKTPLKDLRLAKQRMQEVMKNE